MVQIAGMQSGGKVALKERTPTQVKLMERNIQQARWRAGEGRINSKNKDIKANDQPFLDQEVEARRAKGSEGQGVGSSQGKRRARLGHHLACVWEPSTKGNSQAWGDGVEGE